MSSQRATEQPAESTAADLGVCLLGRPEVDWADHSLSIPRRQARTLLYRLATQLEPVSREQICYLLWLDTPEATARRNLSRLLSHLRRARPTFDVWPLTSDVLARPYPIRPG